MNMSIFSLTRTVLTVLVATSFLYGCSDNKPASQPVKKELKSFKTASNLKGTISDNKGLIKAGELKVTDGKNKLITTKKLQNDGRYKVAIPANTPLPIVLTVSPDKGTKADELVSVVVYSSMTKFDINPLTTKIAKKAKSLGGYTHSNMILAANSMVDAPDKNRTTSGFSGDPTKQYGGWH